jgi:hypothetical protein
LAGDAQIRAGMSVPTCFLASYKENVFITLGLFLTLQLTSCVRTGFFLKDLETGFLDNWVSITIVGWTTFAPLSLLSWNILILFTNKF